MHDPTAFYALVSLMLIRNCLPDYQKVSRVMTKARDDGRVPWTWIVDRSRPSYEPLVWKDLGELGEVLERHLLGFRRDYWVEQPRHVEIFAEKDTVTGSIQPVAEKYGISIETMRGFNSTSNVARAAERLIRKVQEGKSVTILFLGDHDPSGVAIETDLNKRLRSFALGGTQLTDENFVIRRIAIFGSDITKFKLPPLRVKASDSRASGFMGRHGESCVELDALPPSELRRRLRAAIEREIEPVAWERAMLVEAAQRKSCKNFAGVTRKMLREADAR
jgi:hypothetical protein